MEFLATFDELGRRIETIVRGIHYKNDKQKAQYIENGYVEITEDDWHHYIGNYGDGENGTGYIRDHETGLPIDAPAHVPSKGEKAMLLFNECQADLRSIDALIINAIILNDTELIEELRQERDKRVAEYEALLEDLDGGE